MLLSVSRRTGNADVAKVVLTDYPDLDLMKNLELNVSENFGRDDDRRERVSVQVTMVEFPAVIII